MKTAAMIYFSLALPALIFSFERTYANSQRVEKANQAIEEMARFGQKTEKLKAEMPAPAIYAFWLSLIYGGLGFYCLAKSKPESADYAKFQELLKSSKKAD